jgi:hypothetical protein
MSVILSNAKDLGRDSSLRCAAFRMTGWKIGSFGNFYAHSVRNSPERWISPPPVISGGPPTLACIKSVGAKLRKLLRRAKNGEKMG